MLESARQAHLAGTPMSRHVHLPGRIYVTLETAEKTYVKGRTYLCPNDAYVAFYNSELLCGRLGKATLGAGNKAGLFQVS